MEEIKDTLALPVEESSQAGEARRTATWLAQRLGFNETEAGKVAIVAGEAASNMVKYATGGELLLQPLECDGVRGLEIMALDRGPGIADLPGSLRDGYSTGRSPGIGLGAIARLSALFDIYSRPQAGTALLAQLWSQPGFKPPPAACPEFGVLSLAKPGYETNGDGWAIQRLPGRSSIMIADGLGHGLLAARASAAAVQLFLEKPGLEPTIFIEAAHAALRGTRGAAMAVAEVDTNQQSIRFAGVGNIAGALERAGKYQGLVSHHGTVGYNMDKVQEFTYPFSPGALLIIHSDGLSARWSFERYPGLLEKHPALIAGILYRDYGRRNDDTTVAVIRLNG